MANEEHLELINITPEDRLALIERGWKPPEQFDESKVKFILMGHLMTVMDVEQWYYLREKDVPSICSLITIPEPRSPQNKGAYFIGNGWKFCVVSSTLRQMYLLGLLDKRSGAGNANVYRIKDLTI